MQSVEEFLAYAIKLEEEAMLRFGELADSMETYGNAEVAKLFRRLSDYSAMHMGDAKARDVLREHERIVREALKAHGGSEVKTMGDGFMASFGSAVKAKLGASRPATSAAWGYFFMNFISRPCVPARP